MSTALGGRLKKLEVVRRDAVSKQWQTAMDTLLRSMQPEHVALLQNWMGEHCGGLRLVMYPGDTWPAILDRHRPPPLVLAVWLMMAEHMNTRAPVSMAPSVADVYLGDSDAFPTNPCAGCRYLLPTKSTLRPDARYQHIAVYVGECPVCGLDNHPKGAEAV